MKEKAATLNDVADRAGVSPMTVSRVINGESNVRDVTRERVLESVKALNYKPNISARALAGAKSYKVALLYGNPSAFYLSELLVGALEEISKHGHQLLVHKVAEAATGDAVVERLSPLVGEYDGVIVPPPYSDYALVRDFLNENDIPAIFLSSVEGNGRSRKICIDDYRAAKEITQHLIDLGHRRIAHIKGNPNQFSSAERLRGYTDAMKEAGLACEDDLIAPGLFTYSSGLEATEAFLALPTPPSAVFAANDDMAAATLALAASRGVAVPEQLSVVGFDDSPLASSVFPRLTTVRQPLFDMAAAAVDSLIDLVSKNPRPPSEDERRTLMAYQIVHGDSTSRPSSSP